MATKAVNVGIIYFQQFYPFAWHNTAVVIVIRYLYSAVSRKNKSLSASAEHNDVECRQAKRSQLEKFQLPCMLDKLLSLKCNVYLRSMLASHESRIRETSLLTGASGGHYIEHNTCTSIANSKVLHRPRSEVEGTGA